MHRLAIVAVLALISTCAFAQSNMVCNDRGECWESGPPLPLLEVIRAQLEPGETLVAIDGVPVPTPAAAVEDTSTPDPPPRRVDRAPKRRRIFSRRQRWFRSRR